jgi:uncharacterized membrane protein
LPISFLTNFSITLAKLDAVHRLLIGLFFGVVSFFLFEWMDIRIITRLMMSWDVFSFLMITNVWIIFFNIPENKINLLAEREDDSRVVIFVIVVTSLLISLFGIAILLHGSNEKYINANLHEAVSLLSVALSWIMLHTIFTIHYAHLFYDDDNQLIGHCSEGIDFPGDRKPDYLDFAYFSFVIGMTFQVSDTSVSSRKIRRLVLLHSFLSFLFNTIIVALTISIITSQK